MNYNKSMERQISLKQVLIDDTEKTYAVTEKLFQRVSNKELSWKPDSGTNWMTVSQLLMHCASFCCGKAIQGFVKGDWGFSTEPGQAETSRHVPPAEDLPSVESVEQALILLQEDRELALNCLNEVNGDDLLTKRLTAPWGGPELTLFQQLSLMIAHLTQHKGQLFYYLKLMGKDVNTSDLWGA